MSEDDAPRYFDFEERQRQKARSRQRDEERLARGEISAAELQRENMPFRKLRRDKVALYRCKKTGEFRMVSFVREVDAGDDDKD